MLRPVAPAGGQGRGSRFRRPLLLALIATPAPLMLVATPVSAEMPGLLWLPICSASSAHWIAVAQDPARPGDPAPDDRLHGGCAHATCPRETRVGGKARARG